MARLDRRMSVEPTFKFSAAWLADVTFDMNPHVTAKDMSVMLFLVGMAVAQCERDKVLSDVPIRLEMRQFLARTMIQSRAVAEKSFVRIEDMNISGAPVFARLPQVDDGMFVCDVSRIVIQAASYEWADTPEPVDLPIQEFLRMKTAQSIPVAARALAWLRSPAYARRMNRDVSNGKRIEAGMRGIREAFGFTFHEIVPARVTRFFDRIADDLLGIGVAVDFEWRFKGRAAHALRADLTLLEGRPRRQTFAFDHDEGVILSRFPTPSAPAVPVASRPAPAPIPAVPSPEPVATTAASPADRGLYFEANTTSRPHYFGKKDITSEVWATVDHSRPLVGFDAYTLKPIYPDGPFRERNLAVPRPEHYTSVMVEMLDHDREIEGYSRDGHPMYADEPTISEEEARNMGDAMELDFDDIRID